MAKKPKKPSAFKCKAAGVTHDGRQKILRRIKSPTTAALLREPDNPHDENAIAIYVGGNRIGYVPVEIAREMTPVMQSGDWMYHVPWLKVKTWNPDGETQWQAELSIEPRRPAPEYECREHLPGERGNGLLSKVLKGLFRSRS